MPEPSTDFLTPQDVEGRSQGRITATSHPFLPKELLAAQRTIRNYCRWHVTPKMQVTKRKVRPFCEAFFIPAMEIESVDAVKVDGVTLDASTVKFDPETGWTNISGRDVEVTFTAGFDPAPEDLILLAAEMTAGGLGTALNINREQAGAVSVTFTRTSGALVASDFDRLVPYRLGWLP